MKLLIVTQYFWPESFRINALTDALLRQGCEVTVLTGQPNYPEGAIFQGYKALSIKKENYQEARVIRVPLIPRGRSGALRLITNYSCFILSASLLGPFLLRGQQFDAIFVYGLSPIMSAIPAIVLKWIKRLPLLTWVGDLWPESLQSTGFVSNRFLLKMVERHVAWIYRSNTLMLVQSRPFLEPVKNLSGDVPVEYYPNPGEPMEPPGTTSREPALRLTPGFNVVFGGNLGKVQALDTIIEAADLLRDDPAIRFVLIGSGSRSDWLKSEIARRQLTNVQLPGRFPTDDMPGIYHQADALLVSLVKDPTMDLTVPTKVQSYLAAGRPIIAALDGEGSRVVAEAKAGVTATAGDANALASAVRKLKSLSKADRQELGDNGRRFFLEHFDPDKLAQRLLQRITKLREQSNP